MVGIGLLLQRSDLDVAASLRALADDQAASRRVPGYATEGLSYVSFAAARPQGRRTWQDHHGPVRAGDREPGTGHVRGHVLSNGWPLCPERLHRASQSAPGEGTAGGTTGVITWYGDVGLTGTGDGGAIFAWSQERERFGIFAIRLGQAGPDQRAAHSVIGAPCARALRARRGDTVAASPGSPRVTFALHDVTDGRRALRGYATLADVVFWARGLPAGVFAQASDGAHVLGAKVLVFDSGPACCDGRALEPGPRLRADRVSVDSASAQPIT